MVGVRLDGNKELIAVRDGYRESTESWAALLRDLKQKRGMRAHRYWRWEPTGHWGSGGL